MSRMYFEYSRPNGNDPILGQAQSPDCIRVLAIYGEKCAIKRLSSSWHQIFSANYHSIVWGVCLGCTSGTLNPPEAIPYLAISLLPDTAIVLWLILKNARKKGCSPAQTKFFLQIHIGLCWGHTTDVLWVLLTHRKRSYTWPGAITGLISCFCDL